jgi:transposase
VLRALERKESPTQIAKRLEVSRGYVYQVRDRWLKQGRPSSLPVGGYRRSRLAGMDVLLRAWIEAEPDLTLSQICARLAKEEGIQITVSGLWYRLSKWYPLRKRIRVRK